MKIDLFIEHAGKRMDYKTLTDMVKEIWKADGNKIKDLSSTELYYKPEESICYYVINNDVKGSFTT